MQSVATYTLARGEQRFGPYTLEQLRGYVNQGNIHPSDLVWSQGMTTWRRVSEVLDGGVTVDDPSRVEPPPTTHRAEKLKPPSLHWALVLLLAIVTFGFFSLVWAFVQAAWVRKIDPKPKALRILMIGIPLQFLVAFAGATVEGGVGELLDFVSMIIALVTVVSAYFDMRAAMEVRFNMRLSGPMTFFFNVFYLQYHMRRIARGEHLPQSDRILI